MTRSTLLRRLLLAVALLAAAWLGWWAWEDPDPGDDGHAVARRPESAPEAPPLVESPVLRGAPDAEAPPEAPERADRPPDGIGRWRLTFEVVAPDGAPLPWRTAVLEDDRGVERAHATGSGRSANGLLAVGDAGRLVVHADGYRPWVSGWLARPVSGTHHVVARPDPGLAVAGTVFQSDGRTPAARAEVYVGWKERIHPDAAPRPRQVRAEVEEGRFRVSGLPDGPVAIFAQGVVTTTTGGQSWAPTRPVRMEARAGDEDLRVVLGALGRIGIVLVDARTGLAPVTPYVRIDRVDEDGARTSWHSASSREPAKDEAPGPVAHLDAKPGSVHRFHVEAQGYVARDDVELRVPEEGGDLTLRVELEPAADDVCTVRLRLRFEGAPAPEWVLVTRHTDGGYTGHAYRIQDHVVTLELGPGRQEIGVGERRTPLQEGRDWVPVRLQLDLAPGEERELDVVMRLGGWVFLPGDPRPRPRVVRWTRRGEAREARAGPYDEGDVKGWLLGLLPPGRWRFTYGTREVVTGEVDVRVGEVVHVDPASLETRASEEARR